MDTCGNVWNRMPAPATVFRDLRAGVRQAVVSGLSWGVRAAMVESLTSHFMGFLSNDDPEVNHTQARFLANVGAGLSVAVLNLACDKLTRVLLNYGGYTEDTPEADPNNVQMNTNVRDVVYVGSFTVSSLAVTAGGQGMTIVVSGGTGAAAAILTLWVGRARGVQFKSGVVNPAKPDWTDAKRKLIAGAGMGGIAYGFEILGPGKVDPNTVAIWLQRALGPILRLGGWFGCQRMATPAPGGAVTAVSIKEAEGHQTPVEQNLSVIVLPGSPGPRKEESTGLAPTPIRFNPLATPKNEPVKENTHAFPNRRRDTLSSEVSSVPESMQTSPSSQLSLSSNQQRNEDIESGDDSNEGTPFLSRTLDLSWRPRGQGGVSVKPVQHAPSSEQINIHIGNTVSVCYRYERPVQASLPEQGDSQVRTDAPISQGLVPQFPPATASAGSPLSYSPGFTVQSLMRSDNEPGGLGRSTSLPISLSATTSS
jgi:hypothetical protein